MMFFKYNDNLFAISIVGKGKTFIDRNGNYLTDEWYNQIDYPSEGFFKSYECR